MRLIAITLLGAGLIAAADAAKNPATLTTAERLALSDLIAKRGEIEKQIQAIITEGCSGRGMDATRCRLRDDGVFYVIPEPAKPEAKK